MNEHGIMGAIKDNIGALEEGLGKLTGDEGTQLSGQARQLEGQAERLLGKVIDEARTFYREHPVASLLALGLVAMTILSARKDGR